MFPGAQVGATSSPKVYWVDDARLSLNWIAEGTDGYLYVVPSEPGGWSIRYRYHGEVEMLKAVSPLKALAIATYVGGDCPGSGNVAIARICAENGVGDMSSYPVDGSFTW